MVLNILSFFVGFALLLLIPILVFNRKIDKKINVYFFCILLISAIQRFWHGLGVFEIITTTRNSKDISLYLTYFIPPIFYLFFENLLFKRSSLKKDLMLFCIALIIVIVSKTFDSSREINQIVFLVYSTTYLFFLIKIIYKYIFIKKNMEAYLYYKSIKIWSLIMFTLFFLIYLFANFTFNLYINASQNIILNEFYKLSSIIWLFIIIYLLINPIILYGEQLLLKVIAKPEIGVLKIWRNSKINITEKADLYLENIVKPNIEGLLFSIKKFEDDLFNNFQHIPNLKDLSLLLGYPQSHIKYVFKYYNNHSIGEYYNVLKIKYALKLIHDDFLVRETIDSLSIKCLFGNRSTFYKNFKKHTGYSVTDYLITLG